MHTCWIRWEASLELEPEPLGPAMGSTASASWAAASSSWAAMAATSWIVSASSITLVSRSSLVPTYKIVVYVLKPSISKLKI